jgi:hypothetical protein
LVLARWRCSGIRWPYTFWPRAPNTLDTMGSVLLVLLLWKEIPGPVHILGKGLIVGGVVVLNVASSP